MGYKLKETTEFIDNLRFIITLVKGVFDLQFDGLGLGCLMPLSTIFQLYRGSQFYWWRKPEYTEKTRQTLSHNVVSSTPCHERNSNSQPTLLVIGTDYIGGRKSI